MQPVNLVYEDGRLAPASLADHEILDQELGAGELITTELRPLQGDGGKAFWAMIGAAYKSRPEFAQRWSRAEDLADAVKIAIKHRVAGDTISGTPYFISLSLTRVKDWEDFMGKVKACLIEKLGVDPETLVFDPAPEPDVSRETEGVASKFAAEVNEAVAAEEASQAEQEAPKKRTPPKAKDKGHVDIMPAPLCVECANKVLTLAEDHESFGDNTTNQIKVLKSVCADWADTIPEYGYFVELVEENAIKLISCARSDTAKRAKIREYVMASIPVMGVRK